MEAPAPAAGKVTPSAAPPNDPLEEAKMLARLQQQKIERMQEEMARQQVCLRIACTNYPCRLPCFSCTPPRSRPGFVITRHHSLSLSLSVDVEFVAVSCSWMGDVCLRAAWSEFLAPEPEMK